MCSLSYVENIIEKNKYMDFKIEEGLLECYVTSRWDIYKYLFIPDGALITKKERIPSK